MTPLLAGPLLTPLIGAAALGGWALCHGRRQRTLESIPHRILVGGTRGKTTTTRLMAEGLRASGVRVAARITGRSPLAMDVDGRWHPLARDGEPNPDELRRWLDGLQGDWPPEALVVENCGVSPETIWAIGHHMVRPTLCALTDAQSDHLDCWPTRPSYIAQVHLRAAMGSTEILTADPTIRVAAEGNGHSLVPVLDLALGDSLPEWMASHLRCVLSACWWILGDHRRGVAERVVEEARRLLPEAVVLASGAWFLDLFDANDPQSAAGTLEAIEACPSVKRRVAVFADRPDRGWRLRQFEPWMRSSFNEVWVLGASGVNRMVCALQGLGPDTLVVGLGNAVGPAQSLLDHLGMQRRLA